MTQGYTSSAPLIRYPAGEPLTAEDQKVTGLALTFLGVGTLPPEALSETATWDQTGQPSAVGRAKILAALPKLSLPASLSITQVVIQGKAGTISGRLTRDGQGISLFCQVLRFTSATRDQIAQVVSFEQEEKL